MTKISNLTKAAALGLLLALNACKKTDLKPENIQNSEESSTDELGRAGFGDFNRNLTFYALTTTNRIDKYTTAIPKRVQNSVAVTGLQPGEDILGIDFRPGTGQMYGLGSTSRLYVINPETGVARAIGAGAFTPALNGSVTGFDFNPTVDRIRIITSSGQNLRANPETGAIAATDLNINGPAGTIISGAAYTNNMAGATATTLFDVDQNSDVLYAQIPPNDGVLVPVGPLGLDVSDGGFDISGASDAFGMFTINGRSNLIAIDLATGVANSIVIYPATVSYRGLAVKTQPVAYALDASNNLMIFDPTLYYTSANMSMIITKPITGLPAGASILGIDQRPANGQLFALGSNELIYTINTSNGAAARYGPLNATLSGTDFGFDFNPVVDRIRIISNTGQNLRYNPADSTTIVDGALAPGTPAVTGVAYTNNFAGTTTTALFGIDGTSNQLVQVNPANSGTLQIIGNLGVDADSTSGFDIGGATNSAYALFRGTNNRTRIYNINLATGAASGRGIISTNQVRGLAIGLGF